MKGRLVLSLIAIGISAAICFGAVQVGSWLLTADKLDQASFVVVLQGQLPFRAMEAAKIYNEGWVHEIWLSPGRWGAEDEALRQLGIDHPGEEKYDREVLVRLGVPDSAIHLLPGHTENTAAEVRAVARELDLEHGNRVIFVTSKMHSRRVKVLWNKLAGDHAQAIVRYTPDDPSRPDRWWRNTADAMQVSREVFGLLNAWAGFPIKSEHW